MTLTAKEQKILDDLLIEAVGGGDVASAKLYVSRGANVNVTVDSFQQGFMTSRFNEIKYTTSAPLFHYMCAVNFRQDVGDFLLQEGADVDARDSRGNTPLMVAVRSGNLVREKYFLGHGANPLAANNDGLVVLEAARGIDRDWKGSERQQIIDALVNRLPSVDKSAKPAFSASAAPQEGERQGIVAPKTASFGNRARDGGDKPQTGFRL